MKVLSGLTDLIEFIAWFIKYYLPPMVANASPVLVRGEHRIDRGANFIDGKPIFGSNKTWEGLILGVLGSYITGSVLGFVLQDPIHPFLSLGAGISALLGDLAGAFVKRRLGLKPGEPLIPLDQLDFATTSTVYYLLCVRGFAENYFYIVFSLMLVFALHLATNYLAYLIGLKTSKL